MVLWVLRKLLLEDMDRLSFDKEPLRVQTKALLVDRSRISVDSQRLSLDRTLL
jgi:hypothetical protein